jgi:GTP cyclohydrolase IA
MADADPVFPNGNRFARTMGPDGKPQVPDEVAEAVRTLIRWSGDDPAREGLIDTPKRVARAWLEYCSGYQEDPAVHLSRTFEEVGGYDELVLLKDIPFQSHCEHHMAPITGKASIAYMPRNRVVGISKLARVLNGFARRLQVQERLTAEVAQCIWDNLQPHGVAVVIEAQHGCMPDVPMHRGGEERPHCSRRRSSSSIA